MNDVNKKLNKVDVLFVGAGPASLAGAIKLKQILKEKGENSAVVVIEKAGKPGHHNLSGAVFEAGILDELLPGWRERKEDFVTRMLANKVEKDETILLSSKNNSLRIPNRLLPSYLHNKGNYIISLSEMVVWLTDIARSLGVEIYHGFAAKSVVVENGVVKGVKLDDKGLDKEGKPQSNFLPGETIEAAVTVFGEGSLGKRTDDLIKQFGLNKGKNPQVYSVGVKEIIRLPEKNNFGPNRVVHTLGFPVPSDVFGGSGIFSFGPNHAAVSLILGLDWRYSDLNPQLELQLFKTHRIVKQMLEGGQVVAYGARTIPEGGYYSLPELVVNGAVIIGDAAGTTNVRKLKGIHYAMKSGMEAAEAIAVAIESMDFSRQTLGLYEQRLMASFVGQDLRAARNYRQIFSKAGRLGFFLGAPLSMAQGLFPKLGTRPDHEGMRRVKLNRPDAGLMDRATAVNLSGTSHRENEPSHITFKEDTNDHGCFDKFGVHPCQFFCPAHVYKFENDELILSPSNCVHCQTCRVKCPRQVIQWEVPEGGDGPKYKVM
ncbi:MAG: electron-transfer flavoprotein:ubiquinone oxidoreductase [Dehalococcoidales bacterium]|nr:electron-transfer flavoprotein:ubiquinone oxidoreductase [Dehalococcoidales bacterium]